MRYFLFMFLFIGMVASGFAQSKFALSFNGGYDMNSQHLVDLRKVNTNEIPDFSGGVNLIYYLGKNIRLRAEADYSNVSFTRDYQTDPTVAKNVASTEIALNFISLNPHVDYKLISLAKLDLYAGAGIRFEFEMMEWQRTYNQRGDILSGKYLNEVLNPGQIGAVGSVLLKYNITEKLGIQVAPEYTYFLHPLFASNANNFQRMSLKAGVEWRF